MNESEDTLLSWSESHPWLSPVTVLDEDDSVDESTRYALDEIRLE